MLATGSRDRRADGRAQRQRRPALGARERRPPDADPKAHPTGVAVTFVDITERRVEQERLRLATELFATAFAEAPIGIALVALDGGWLRVNPRLCEIVGYTEEELLQRTFQDITHPDDLDLDLALLEATLAGARRATS